MDGGFLIVNPRSGSARPNVRELGDEARARGIRVHVLRPDDDPAEIARGADAETLGVAGGDGSLAAGAGNAIERDLPFLCVPFGTHNHLARDLRPDPRGPRAARDALTA